MSKPTETAIIESALTAIEGILTLPILPDHQRGLIDGMLWAITEAWGKYTTRYQSLAARNAPKGTKLQHEHVIPRKQLLAAIMLHPERAREIARTAIGCVVTKQEHDHLTRITREQPYLAGWDRYKAAGITVIDTGEQQLPQLPAHFDLATAEE